jgi:hypothetical protein
MFDAPGSAPRPNSVMSCRESSISISSSKSIPRRIDRSRLIDMIGSDGAAVGAEVGRNDGAPDGAFDDAFDGASVGGSVPGASGHKYCLEGWRSL